MEAFAAKGTQDRRDILLKVVTITVLLLSTGAAWLFVLARSSATNRAKSAMTDSGDEALGQIRNQGLDHYWGSGTQRREDWYLLYSDRSRSPEGWRAVIRWREPDGTHKGLELQSPQGVWRWEYWQLNGQGTAGHYEAGGVSTRPGSPHLQKKTITKIILDQGRVELHQPGRVSEAAVPESYVPEGMLDLACFVAMVRGSDAEFRVIFNDDPPDGKVVRFGSATVTDIRHVQRGVEALVTKTNVRGGSGKRMLLFNQAGLLVGTTVDSIREQRVARDTIVRIFRNANYVEDVFTAVTASATRPKPE